VSRSFAICGADIGLGDSRLQGHAVLVSDGNIVDVMPVANVPNKSDKLTLNGGTLIPGFVDLQVNGGGGVLFNNDVSTEAIQTICAAHTKLGTCRLLVTLISSSPENTSAAIDAAISATAKRIPGFLGLHLEGPHLSSEKRGAHSNHFLRPMLGTDIDMLCTAKSQLPYLMITVAPEVVTPAQIEQLANAGIVVSLGHSNANYNDAMAAFNHGARCATHLFNAMSPLNHREPGMVGAALTHSKTYAGLIADGVHVHPAAIHAALKSKSGSGKIFVVSDAMATAGSNIKEFELDGRTIVRNNGRLELSDGTLAGADTNMLSSLHYLINNIGMDGEEAVRMVSSYPSACIGALDYLGSLVPGHSANIVHIDDNEQLQQTWVDGEAQLG